MRRNRDLYILIFVLFGSWCWGGSALAQEQNESMELLIRRLGANPTIGEVQRAAIEEAELESRRDRRVLRRLRAAAVLPRVEASLTRGASRDEDLDRAYEEMDELSLATDEDLQLRVVLRWDLERLIYDPEELRARREASYRVQRREELVTTVTRYYYELLALRVQQELDLRVGGGADNLERRMRIAELRAMIDGLTGRRLSWQ